MLPFVHHNEFRNYKLVIIQVTYSVTEMQTVLRDDVAVNAQQSQSLLNNAPEHQDTLIKVPAILDGGAEG